MRQQDREQQTEAVQTLSQHSTLIQCTGNNPSCPITQSLEILARFLKKPHIKRGRENRGGGTAALGNRIGDLSLIVFSHVSLK